MLSDLVSVHGSRLFQTQIACLVNCVVPCAGKNLAQTLVDSVATTWQAKKEIEQQAAELFKMFRKYEFTGSHRFGSDVTLTNDQKTHREILDQIRNDPRPVTRTLLNERGLFQLLDLRQRAD